MSAVPEDLGPRWAEEIRQVSEPNGADRGDLSWLTDDPDKMPLLPRHPLNWKDLESRAPEPRAWAVEDWLPMGNAALLAGRGGIGKTLLAQTIGTCLALRLNYFAETPQSRRVLMWAGEDEHDELWRRQLAICEWAGVGIKDLSDKLIVHSYHGQDLTLAGLAFGQLTRTSLMQELQEQVEDYRADYVFLDSLARIFGGSENDRHQVTTFVSWLATACAKAGVCILGHPGKAQGAEYSGSTAWEGSVRARLYLGERLPDAKHGADDADEPDDTIRYLARRKANYSAKDFVRLEYCRGVLVPCQRSQESFGGVSNEYAQDTVVRAVRKFADLNMICTASTRSADYLPKLAKQYGLLDQMTDRQFTQAMRKLIVDKRLITVEVGRYSNRNPRMGLRVAP
jgi:RecA-family ATPase